MDWFSLLLKRGSIKIIDPKNAQFPWRFSLKAKIQPIVESIHSICHLFFFIMHEYTIKCQLNVCIIGIGSVVYLFFRNCIAKSNVLFRSFIVKNNSFSRNSIDQVLYLKEPSEKSDLLNENPGSRKQKV